MRILGIIFLLTICGSISAAELKSGQGIPDAGRKMLNVDGKQIAVNDIKGKKGTVVAFWCNHCPYVVKYRKRFVDIAGKYKSKGFGFIAVNSNDPSRYKGDSFDKMKKAAAEYKYPFPYVVDKGSRLAKAYGAAKTPHIYVFDGSGKLVYVGAIDDSTNPENVSDRYLVKALDALLAGKAPVRKSSRAFGCSIKWYSK